MSGIYQLYMKSLLCYLVSCLLAVPGINSCVFHIFFWLALRYIKSEQAPRTYLPILVKWLEFIQRASHAGEFGRCIPYLWSPNPLLPGFNPEHVEAARNQHGVRKAVQIQGRRVMEEFRFKGGTELETLEKRDRQEDTMAQDKYPASHQVSCLSTGGHAHDDLYSHCRLHHRHHPPYKCDGAHSSSNQQDDQVSHMLEYKLHRHTRDLGKVTEEV